MLGQKMSRRFIITVALSLFALGANARDKSSSEVILSKLHELSSTVMSDFSRVSITSEPALLVMEADAFVRNETAVNAAGRQSGTRRVATAGRQGFVIRLEHRENANSVRRNAETDRGDYIEFSAKIILSQEKPGQSTDTRAEAIFLDYQLGKNLPEPWRIRISKLIKELEAFDVTNKEGQGGADR